MARSDLLNGSGELTVSFGRRRVPLLVVAGFAALALAWLGIVYFAEPWGRLAGSGMDARCYWVPDLANPYLNSNWTDQIAYPYSPAFLQLLQPIRLLPWQVFMAIWAAVLMAAMVYLTGPRLILLGLAFFGLMEIWGGNIELLVALAIVVGFRWPAAWSFVLLTKITPGVGLLWFAVRREWRSLAIAIGATAAVAAVSAIVAPDAWGRWIEVLQANAGKNGTWAAVPIPFAVRFPFALILVVWGARTNRRWTVPVSSMLALPALWYGGLSIMLATLPLLGARSWGDLRRVYDQARTELASSIAGARLSRHPRTVEPTARPD
ncbi:MAG: glycosyltransferase 87 family protein [Candidatus Limnocylindrales bacterium]